MTFTNSTVLTNASRNMLKAVTHAEVVMESIKNTAFVAIPSNMGGAPWGAWTLNTAAVNAAGLTALNNETIVTTLTGVNPVDVTVTVSWREQQTRNRSLTLRTLISG